MNELVVIEQKPLIPEKWNYEDSVSKMKPAVYKLKNLTFDIANELWVAREKLSEVGNPNWNKSSNSKTWSDYCMEIGRK